MVGVAHTRYRPPFLRGLSRSDWGFEPSTADAVPLP